MTENRYKIEKLKTHKDQRGWLVEMIKRVESKDSVIKQINVFSIKPGKIRGNHYHSRTAQWLFIINGTAECFLEDFKIKKKTYIKVSPREPKIITIFPMVAHAVKNISRKMIYGVEAQTRVYNPKKPDKVFYKVI